MVIPHFFVGLVVLAVTQAVPLNKRIAQTIADSTTKWEQACLAAGGADKCNPQSQASFNTLLAAAGPCDQQNQGDAMIDLAKQLNSDPDMIKFTQIFVQQPRNSPDALSVPYCQVAPKNAELNGLFQCQFDGSNPTLFVGGIQVGGNETIPFGKSTVLSPLGSCPANAAGPVADGTQLTDITDDPGVGSETSNSSKRIKRASFTLQNGLDAQKLNAEFATLTAASSCTDGTSVCVNGQFAQCSGGKLVSTACAPGLQCFALPLDNKPGTSVTCDTAADAQARIAATGATGGLTGRN